MTPDEIDAAHRDAQIINLKARIAELEKQDVLRDLLDEYPGDPALAKIAARVRAEQYGNPVPEQHL